MGCNINRSVLLAQIPKRHHNKTLPTSPMHQMPHSKHQHTPHCYNTNRNIELHGCPQPLANLNADMKKPAGSTISCAYHRLARSLAHPLTPQTGHSSLLVARILTAFLRLGFRYLPFGRRQASWLTVMAFAVSRTATNASCLSLQGPFSRSLSAWPGPTQYIQCIDTMVRAHSDVTIDGQSVCQSVQVSSGLCSENCVWERRL